MTPHAARRELQTLAIEQGFDTVAVAPVENDLRADYFRDWLNAGKHGDMHWLAKNPERRSDPANVLPEAASILVFGMNYYQPEPSRRGRIAKYALGKDYHKVIIRRLKRICQWLQAQGAVNRPYVDTGPLLERPLAAAGGAGWQGKNTMLLNGEHGQWLFLGFILTSFPFPPDKKQKDRCGSCTRCIDICPTGAITAPYQMDARKCISYLTIENKGPIPLPYRRLVGDHLYGCDDCLDVCPWNRWAKTTRIAAFRDRDYPDLRDLLLLTEQQFNDLFAGSPIRRLKRNRFLRNVSVVLGNIGTEADLPALAIAAQDPDPLIHEHAEWAIEELRCRLALS